MGFISLKPGYASPFCVESASAVSDAPRVAKPKVLRASKKVCVCGGVFSLTNAAGGGATRAVAGAGSTTAGATAKGTPGFISAGAGDTLKAMVVFGVEAAFAADAEAGAGAAEADVDVDSDAGGRRPSSPRAKADDPKNTNSMAATAILTALLPTRTQNECSTIE